MIELTQAQVRKLKSRAQRLEPLLRLGRAGASEAFVKSMDEAFKHHELIKIRFDDFKDERREIAPQLADRTGSRFVWMVGHVAVFYRPHPDPAQRKLLND